MNGNYYQNPNFNNNEEIVNENRNENNLSVEHNFLENILIKNYGKVIKVYATYPESNEYRDKVFSGIIQGAGQGHLILKDPSDGKWYLILLFYLDYIEFEEAIY